MLDLTVPAPAYIIAALPRTGSYRLCEMLTATALCGYPQEYGPLEDEETWRHFHGFSSHLAYFHYFFRVGRSSNGVFGCKLMWPQFAALRRDITSYLRIEGSGLSSIESMLGPVSMIFLQRHDRVMQAISLYRAMCSGAWSSRAAAATTRPYYDRQRIADALGLIGANEALWERFFSDHQIEPCRIWYEDLMEGNIDVVFDVIGAGRQATAPGLLERQADALSLAWRDRFVDEIGMSKALFRQIPGER